MLNMFACAIVYAQADMEKTKRESVEWLDLWMPKTNETGLPRVLLIGNSIIRQYYPELRSN